MKTMIAAVLSTALVVAATAASAAPPCPALAGTTFYDSTHTLVGDPFFGGRWSNAKNGKAYVQRSLTKPATLYGFSLGQAGSDMTTVGSRIAITAKKPDGTTVTLLDLRGVAVGRDFSPGGAGTVTSPLFVRFPPVEVKSIRVDMTGNGWFLLYNLTFNVLGCS